MDELKYQVDLLSAMNERIQADERMYRLVCSTSSNAFIYIDLTNDTIKALGNFDSFFKDVTLNRVSDLTRLYPYISDSDVLKFGELITGNEAVSESRSDVFKMKKGGMHVEVEVVIVEDESFVPTDKIIRFRDVTKFKQQNDELTYLAYFDANTGLYNRNYFVRLLSEFIRRAEEEKTVVSVMFFDIDGFHNINDGMGLVEGDELVQQFGQMLLEYKSDRLIVSHFNADVYCVAIYDPRGKETPDVLYKTIKERTKMPFKLSSGNEVGISFCCGVAEFPEAAQNTLELINCAEIVMFKAKKRGRGQIQYFDADILRDFLNTVDIENRLKEAVFNRNFMMKFQPQYYTATKKLRGVEALIRWKDNDGKMIPPSEFIPIAEKNGAIIPIGTWVIDESIRIYSEWKRKYGTDIKLSLNVSAIQYRSDDFLRTIMSIINKYDIDKTDIELEITESVFIDDVKDVTDKLMVLRDYGIKISLDDFGTGYSSLSYLKGLPIDTLKIDKSFIDEMNTDENSLVILETIIYMSKKLGLETIAEGVESKEQYDFLSGIDCDIIQGFYFGKPVSDTEIEELLKLEKGIY